MDYRSIILAALPYVSGLLSLCTDIPLPLFFLCQFQNGMTPLHLAVWHALRAEDSITVSTLLEYNADCSVKDNVSFHYLALSDYLEIS